MFNLINFVLFQIGWFVTVISVAKELEYAAILAVFCIIGIHLLLVEERLNEILLVLIVGFVGTLVDSLLISQGVFVTSGNLAIGNMAPLWLVMLWMLFSITINHSLKWLRKSYIAASCAGFVFAPIAYYFGQKFEALSFEISYSVEMSLLMIGITWAIVTPLLIFVSCTVSSGNLKLAR